MIQAEPLITIAVQLAQEFLRMIHDRQVDGLRDWMKRTREYGIDTLKSFVKGLESD